MTSELFKKYISDVFLPYTAGLRTAATPVILILDNFSGHLEPSMLNLAAEHHVHLLGLPAHSTHLLQPLDVGLMGPFKQHYYSAQSAWRAQDDGRNMLANVTTPTMMSLLAKQQSPHQPAAFDAAFNPHNIRSAFAKTGKPLCLEPTHHGGADAFQSPHVLPIMQESGLSIVTRLMASWKVKIHPPPSGLTQQCPPHVRWTVLHQRSTMTPRLQALQSQPLQTMMNLALLITLPAS